MKTLEERIEDWYFECYYKMIKTNFDPAQQIGWVKNIMYYSRALRDDAVEWYDIVDDLLAGEYFDKWKNTDSVKYDLEHMSENDFSHLQHLCSKYMTSIATNKIHSYNKKVEKISNEASLSTDEYEFDLENIADNEEDFDEESEQLDDLFSMIGQNKKYSKLNKVYNIVNAYLADYECSEWIKQGLYKYIEEKIKNPYLTQREACKLADINHCTVRKFLKAMRTDEYFLKQLHDVGIYFMKDLEK